MAQLITASAVAFSHHRMPSYLRALPYRPRTYFRVPDCSRGFGLAGPCSYEGVRTRGPGPPNTPARPGVSEWLLSMKDAQGQHSKCTVPMAPFSEQNMRLHFSTALPSYTEIAADQTWH